MLALNVGRPSNVPGPKPPFFDAVLVGDLAPWQAVFSVGVPNPMTLVLKQDTPGVDSPIFMELLDLYTEVFAEVQSNFLWGSVRGPSADDLLFGLLGASAQSQGKAQGRPKSYASFLSGYGKVHQIDQRGFGWTVRKFVQQRHSPVTVFLHLGFGVCHSRPFEDEVHDALSLCRVVFASFDSPHQ